MVVALARARARCIPLYVPNAAKTPPSRSSPVATARFTAAIASASSGHLYGQTGKADSMITEGAIVVSSAPIAGGQLPPTNK